MKGSDGGHAQSPGGSIDLDVWSIRTATEGFDLGRDYSETRQEELMTNPALSNAPLEGMASTPAVRQGAEISAPQVAHYSPRPCRIKDLPSSRVGRLRALTIAYVLVAEPLKNL